MLLLGRANDGELTFSAVVLIALNGDLNRFGSDEGVGFAHQLQYALHPIITQHWMPANSYDICIHYTQRCNLLKAKNQKYV